MNVAAGPELAAAVSNAGGLGVIGGLGYTYVTLYPLSTIYTKDRLIR
jgi:NAD(P)H-dependent flavin oxidoreductase YrpB (nitropropane dioxygenase family)